VTKVKDLIRRARGKTSQKQFAKQLGKSQGLLSKYEKGLVNPPSDVIEKCLDILDVNTDADISSEELAKRIRMELRGMDFSFTRKTIAALLDGIQGKLSS